MGTELILAIVGPLLGATFGVTTFLYRRSMSDVDNRLDGLGRGMTTIIDKIHTLQTTLPERYITKDELARHIASEASWQDEILHQLREVRASMPKNPRYPEFYGEAERQFRNEFCNKDQDTDDNNKN